MAIELDRLVTILGFKTDLSGVRAFENRVDGIQDKLDGVGDGLVRVGTGIAAFGGAITAAFGAAAASAISWETDFTDVRKTIDGTEADFARLEARLREMARQDVPLPVGELAALAASAGQLGIQTDFVDEFVETMAQLGVTTNLSSEQAATGFARLANIMGTSQGNFSNLGSTVVDLGNNLATTEAEILDMGLRLAGTGKLVGLSEDQVLAFSAALSSVGIESEMGGTAFSRVWADMQAAVQTGGKELEAFGQVAGVTGGEFAGMFEFQGADAATQAFIAGLQQMIDDGENVHEVLETLGFDSVRVRDALLRAAGSGELFNEALAIGSEAWEENNALTREAELRFQTAASQIQFIKNDIREFAITIGNVLLPALKDILDDIRPVVDRVIEWAEENPKLVKGLAVVGLTALAVGGALTGVGLALKSMSFALGGISVGVGAVKGIAVAFGAVKLAALAAAPAIWGALAPLLPILLPIAAAIALAALAIWYYWEPITTFFAGVWEGLKLGSGETSAAFERLGSAMGRLREELGPLGNALSPVADLLRELFGGRSDTDLTEQGKSFGAYLSEELTTAIDKITAVIDGIATLVGWIRQLVDWFNQVRDAVAGFNEAISPENVFAQLGRLNDYLSQFSLYDAGRALFQTFIDGITAPGDMLKEAVEGKLKDIRNLLPSSDAREGPLADITMSGRVVAADIRGRHTAGRRCG